MYQSCGYADFPPFHFHPHSCKIRPRVSHAISAAKHSISSIAKATLKLCRRPICLHRLLHTLLLILISRRWTRSRLLSQSPAASPPHQALLPRPPQNAKHKRSPHEADTRASAQHPAALRIKVISRRRAHELTRKDTDGVSSVDAIARQRSNAIDGAAARNLRGLHPEIDGKGLDDGPGDGKGANISADAYPDHVDDLPDNDRVQRRNLVHHEARIQRAKAHASDTDERKQPNDQAIVAVRRRGQQKSQRRPKRREDGRREEGDQAVLQQQGLAPDERDDAPEHLAVVQPVRVRGRVVRHEEPQQGRDDVLQAEREPVDGAPARVRRDDAGQQARDQDAEQHAGDDEGEGAGAAVRRREAADEREHDLRRHRRDGGEEGERFEGGEGRGDAEADPGAPCCVSPHPFSVLSLLLLLLRQNRLP